MKILLPFFQLLIFGFVLIVSVNGSRDDECYEGECENPLKSDEQMRCEMVRDELFRNVNQSHEIYRQWKRYLPVFMKTQYGLFTDNRGEQEFPLGHERFNMLGPVGAKCKKKLEKYGEGDEEKRVCSLSKLQNINKAVTMDGKEECVILSIGSNDQWNFETAVIERTRCRIETFDCTVSAKSKPPKALRDRVKLHRICLSDANTVRDGRKYMDWPSLLNYIGLKTAPTYLKMDIEGYEFPVMKNMIDGGHLLPLQVSMEIHIVRHENNAPVYNRRVSSMELHSFMDYLHEFGGYHLLNRRDNPLCISCSEIVLAKLDCDSHPLRDNYELLMGKEQLEPLLRKALKESVEEEYYN
jgi:hypothetical protein